MEERNREGRMKIDGGEEEGGKERSRGEDGGKAIKKKERDRVRGWKEKEGWIWREKEGGRYGKRCMTDRVREG